MNRRKHVRLYGKEEEERQSVREQRILGGVFHLNFYTT